MPLLAALLPVLSLHHFTDEWVEWLGIGVLAAIGVVGYASAYVRDHRHTGPAMIFVAGLTLIIVTRLTLGDQLMEPAAVAAGGLMGATAHWANIRLCRCCHAYVAAVETPRTSRSAAPGT